MSAITIGIMIEPKKPCDSGTGRRGYLFLRLAFVRLSPARPRTTRRRIASARAGLSSCRAAQASIARIISGCHRKPTCMPHPVAGRPLFFLVPFFIDAITKYGTK
jgi:hypothetical protein